MRRCGRRAKGPTVFCGGSDDHGAPKPPGAAGRRSRYLGETMAATATIGLSIIGTGIGVLGVLGAMLRILTTKVTRELQAGGNHIGELKTDLEGRIDEINKRIDGLTTEMQQRFDRVYQALGNRERWPSSKERSKGSWRSAATGTRRERAFPRCSGSSSRH